jgi:hypothetical protein
MEFMKSSQAEDKTPQDASRGFFFIMQAGSIPRGLAAGQFIVPAVVPAAVLCKQIA